MYLKSTADWQEKGAHGMYGVYPNVISVDLELENVPGTSAAVGVLVVLGDADALDRAPHAAHLGVYGVNLGARADRPERDVERATLSRLFGDRWP